MRLSQALSRALIVSLLVTSSAVTLPGVMGCGEGELPEQPPRQPLPLQLNFEHRLMVQTSAFRFELPDDPEFLNKNARLTLRGTLGQGQEFEHVLLLPVTRDATTKRPIVEVKVNGELWEALNPEPEVTFTGSLTLELQDISGLFARGQLQGVLILFTSVLRPQVSAIPSNPQSYPGQEIKLRGEGFLRPEEGTTWAVIEQGSMTYDAAPARDLSGQRVAIKWGGSRQDGVLAMVPDPFGILPGLFEGKLRMENELADGEVYKDAQQLSFRTTLQRPFVSAVNPPSGSRSQIIRILGRGFLATSPKQGYGMLLKFDGSFTPDLAPDQAIDYRGPRAVARAPYRVVSESLIQQDVWYEVDRDSFTLGGLGATPGVFSGKIIPILLYQGNELIGDAWSGEFRVLATTQVVHVRFIAGFEDALDRFGLSNASDLVRARILEVLRRDYEGINVRFVTEPPEDFVDYMTIEIGGPDPTGQGLLGYDNSFNGVPKDTSNLFLRDYLGGYNRDSIDAGFEPYGGVFIESFTIFSPKLSKDQGFETSKRFDELLGPFMPELGGTPVKATELPDGGRVAAIRAAVLMIGNLVGHTASHEIGHSLGLPYLEGEDPKAPTYHNPAPEPAAIMNAGNARSFEERAELDGQGPARFNATNRAYLRRILPAPQ